MSDARMNYGMNELKNTQSLLNPYILTRSSIEIFALKSLVIGLDN